MVFDSNMKKTKDTSLVKNQIRMTFESIVGTMAGVGHYTCFMQLAFNLCTGVTDTLESSKILIYSTVTHEFIYTNGRQDTMLIKWLIKSK